MSSAQYYVHSVTKSSAIPTAYSIRVALVASGLVVLEASFRVALIASLRLLYEERFKYLHVVWCRDLQGVLVIRL